MERTPLAHPIGTHSVRVGLTTDQKAGGSSPSGRTTCGNAIQPGRTADSGSVDRRDQGGDAVKAANFRRGHSANAGIVHAGPPSQEPLAPDLRVLPGDGRLMHPRRVPGHSGGSRSSSGSQAEDAHRPRRRGRQPTPFPYAEDHIGEPVHLVVPAAPRSPKLKNQGDRPWHSRSRRS
jgi:hypothetical protein